MKHLLKNKVFIGCTATAAAAAIVIAVILLLPNKKIKTSGTSSQTSEITVIAPEVAIPEPADSAKTSEETKTAEKEKPDIAIDVGGGDTNKPSTDKSKQNVKDSEKPVTPKEPEQPKDEGGIQIGDGGKGTKYNCGCPNHHCENAEFHAGLLNRELEGCPYCGSHSCPSFYDLNEWGYTQWNPSKCPKYDIKKDPVEYCQKCGKKNGDGRNGTCVQFLNACDCPNCGQHVEAKTCHTCK